MLFYAINCFISRLIPVGRRGYTKISQTPFYQVLGPIGLCGLAFGYGLAAMSYWKVLKFCVMKIKFVGIDGDRM